MNEPLLTRDEFRVGVFTRDGKRCVICKNPGQDAHHIMERRLFADGGYYLSNGATLCGPCHLKAESTQLSCEEIRTAAGITKVVLPEDFYPDTRYEKWGNICVDLINGDARLRGPLFYDESVQKVLAPVLHLYVNRVKHPRTMHLPWSPGKTDDDRTLESTDSWIDTQVIITKKLDGENCSLYKDGLHARSLEFASRIDRDRIKAIHAEIAHEIPENFRVCGENMTAVHSIKYTDLRDWFYVHSVWNGATCLSWKETMEWCQLLGMTRASGKPLSIVPLMYWGEYSDAKAIEYCNKLDFEKDEGLVVRPAEQFQLRDFSTKVGKFVRAGHVRTQAHWTRHIEFNDIRP